ncbi:MULTISPECIES: DUF3987 domain-containing protein [unclassified Guyparkeria]|uniref:DUF3987 domain-containing protein n=1 Tax=unclassified Guyparkeria TaxID=2626246 RepID=UPI0007339F5E|nr:MULTISPECIES: DUF3987 domain-containing protein [unclassified Guyparkeria]KTG15993.1 hypothetical protein AUR63_05965 [Guyparkeria sp. XI15]OAE84748.1 hypothetical protein AWR35_05975 [Guyparkeria sp. WRN-7]
MSIAAQAEAVTASPMQEEADDRDYTIAPPKADPAMFHGLVGEVAEAATTGREPNRSSVALAFLTWLSAAAGRHHFIAVGDQTHPLLINGLHVGRSMVAAKGESWALVKRIRHAVGEMMDGDPVPGTDDEGAVITPELFAGRVHSGGLSTGEGLAAQVHDGYMIGKTEHAPIDDKRLLIIEAEFAKLLEQGKREGNTLSPIIRDLFDGGSIQPATKSASVWATEPHVVIHGAITPHELRARMDATAAFNGLMNRFLVIFAERTCLVPFPEPTPDEVVRRLAIHSRDVIKFARGDYPRTKYAAPITLSDEAREMYREAYPDLRRRDGSTPIITSLLERRAPITMRLAGLFAMTDQTAVIGPAHMRAALAWSRFHRESVAYVFGHDITQRIESSKRDGQKQKILEGIPAGRWVTRTFIQRDVFAKRITSKELTAALDDLLADGMLEQRERSKQNGIGNLKEYSRPAQDAQHAQDRNAASFAPLRNSAQDAQQGRVGPESSPHVAHVAQRCADAETRTRTGVAHDAHVAHGADGNDDEVVI